jgi:hypothetical protein
MGNERLLWSRDIRFVRRVAARLDDGHLLDLENGVVLIGPADALTHLAVEPGLPAELLGQANSRTATGSGSPGQTDIAERIQ